MQAFTLRTSPLWLSLFCMTCLSAQQMPYSSKEPGYAYPLDKVANGRCVPAQINDVGQVVGISYTDESELYNVGFFTGPNGAGSSAVSKGTKQSYAFGINILGQVVGIVQPSPSGGYRGFVTEPSGSGMRRVGTLGTIVADINDSGQMVGTSVGGAFITKPGGAHPQNLVSLGETSSANSINERGQVAGLFTTKEASGLTVIHAFATGPDGLNMVDLALPGATSSRSTGINDKGEVVGTQWIGKPLERHQFIANSNGTDIKLLGSLDDLPGGYSEGTGINNAGWIVGVSSRGKRYNYIPATIASRDTPIRDLNDFVKNLPKGVYLTGNPQINNKNQIATNGSDGICYIVCPREFCAAE